MSAAEDFPERPSRRLGDRGAADTPRARQGRLALYIRSDRHLVEWLGQSKARTLRRVAAELVDAGHRDAAALVHRAADDLDTGNVSPF